MNSSPDYPKRLQAIRDAYVLLPEPLKIQVSQVVSKKDPKLFKLWFHWANPPGYSRPQGAAGRPPGTGKRFDDALLKSDGSASLLRRIPAIFFANSHPEWIEWVERALQDSTPETVEADLEPVLQRADAPFRGADFEALFLSRSRLLPESWLDSESEESAEDLTAAGDGDVPPVTVTEPLALDEQFEQLRVEVEACDKLLTAARSAKPFDQQDFVARLKRVEQLGVQLRTRLQEVAEKAELPEPTWTTAEELRDRLRELHSAADQAADRDRRCIRLQSIAGVLRHVSRLTIRSQSRRADAENARLRAIEELDAAALATTPPTLPGEHEGVEWFVSAMSLAETEFNTLLQDLTALSLTHLARFLEEIEEWNRVVLVADSAELPRPNGTAPAHPTTPKKEAFESIAAPEAVASAESLRSSIPAPEPPTPNGESVESVAVGIQTIPTAPPAAIPPTQNVPVVHQDDSDYAESEVSDPIETFVPTLLRLDEDEKRPLLVDYIAALPAEAASRLPPLAAWQALALQPWLRRSDDETAERIRKLLAEVVQSEYEPRAEADALLLWSTVILPTFVDSGSDAAGLLGTLPLNLLPNSLAEFTQRTLAFIHEVPRCSIALIRGGASRNAWEQQLTDYRAELIRFCEHAQNHTFKFPPATRVWHHLNKPGGRLHTLATVAQGPASTKSRAQLEQALAELQDHRQVRKIIDAETRAVAATKFEPIISAPLQQLERRIADFQSLLARFVRHLEVEPTQPEFLVRQVQTFRNRALPLLRTLETTLPAQNHSPLFPLGRGAAIRAGGLVLELFDADSQAQPPRQDQKELQRVVRLRIPDLKIEHDRVQNEPAEVLSILSRTAGETLPSFHLAFEARSKAGDISNARILLEAWDPPLSTSERDHYQVSIDERAAAAKARAQTALTVARRSVLNARTLGVMPDSAAAQRINTLVAIEGRLRDTENYAGVLGELELIKRDLDQLSDKEASKLRRDIQSQKLAGC